MIEFTHFRGVHDSVRKMTGDLATERAARGSIESLECKVERQGMLIQTLLMLLLEKKVIQESEYEEWLKYVDGLDGRVDGRLRPSNAPQPCGSCGRKNSPSALRCQYCGMEFGATFLDPRHKAE